ncbi:MAG: HAMP domain-containing protein [Chloroflexi bacterium]|nr:HAMP domain-containing protein [Chloroflexota bacterium]
MVWRLGLQKRIMLYVTLGLVIMFGAFFYLGVQAAQRSTALVFEERLVTAEGVAGALASDLAHVIRDVPAHTARAASDSGAAGPEAIAQHVYLYLAEVDVFGFFKVSGFMLLHPDGRILAVAPQASLQASEELLLDLLANGAIAGDSPHVLWSQAGQRGSFVTISVPLRDDTGNIWAWALVNTVGFNSTQPFVPFGLNGLRPNEQQTLAPHASAKAEYHLEVLAPPGIVVIGVGPDEEIGQLSPHVPLLEAMLESRGSRAMLHEVADRATKHVMAAAPVPLSDLYVVLEQGQDVALAVPAQLRRNLLVFSVLGLLSALTVAWVTTRHVVKPTELLTAAAVRMARGELSSPIRVQAQDEIGVLAENLESMRQQLQDALEMVELAKQELETRVQERTSQLRDLVRRVLTAQEEERRRVALELHDETAQALTALSVTLDSLLRAKNTLGEDTIVLQEARQIAGDMMEGLRRLIRALRPVALQEMRLAAALGSYAEDYLGRLRVTAHATVEGTEARMADEVELTLYRIGQEALNNVARHAKATNVWIALVYDSTFVRLKVRDDGVGFSPQKAAEPGGQATGLGLAGMRERAGLVGGRLTIDSAPGKGTLVQVEVPIPANG